MKRHDMNFVAQILDTARPCGVPVEVYLVREEIASITWGTEGTRTGWSKGGARGTVRVIVDGRLGWSTGSLSLSPQQVFSVACVNARFGPPATWMFAESGADVCQPDIALPQPFDPLALCEQAMYLATMVSQHRQGVHAIAAVTVTESRRTLVTGRDAVWNYECPRAHVTLSARVSQLADVSFINVEKSGVTLGPLLTGAIESMEVRLAVLEHPVQSLKHLGPVVLAPDAAKAFIFRALVMSCVPTGDPEWLTHPCLRWHSSVTVWDDGTAADFPGSALWDDEGVPSQRTLLVENGIPSGYIVDRALAAQYCVSPTGNGIRGEMGLPSPQFRKIIFEPQRGGESRTIADLPSALLVYDMNLIETADSARIAARVNLAVFMHWGEPIYRVTNGILQGNFVEALRAAIPVDDRAAAVGSKTVPYLLIEAGLAFQV